MNEELVLNIVEETTGRFNSYGELIADVVEESD